MCVYMFIDDDVGYLCVYMYIHVNYDCMYIQGVQEKFDSAHKREKKIQYPIKKKVF